MKDFAGRIISFEESGKNYLQRDRENQVRRELRIFQFFVLGFHLISRSFRNLLKSLLNFDAPNPETLSAIREQRPSD